MLRLSNFLACGLMLVMFSSPCQSAPSPPTVPPVVPASTRQPTPSFLRTGCLYPVTPEDQVECGFLLVPEVRNQPDSRIIRLHVVRFKSTSDHPAPDPLVLLNGGPGSPGAPVVSGILNDLVGIVWRAERDVIYLDQRGSGFSLPSLHCEAAVNPDEMLTLSYAEHLAVDTKQVQACYQALQQKGINLTAYNLLESAADINDLRLALGYTQVNLYGFSYGSLLAQTVMRLYPTTVRSVILDAVLPPGVDLRAEKPASVQRALDALFTACAADTKCQQAYPNLATVFYTIVDRLRQAPVQVVLPLGDDELNVALDDLKFVHHLVYHLQANAVNTLPADIYAAYHGDYTAPAWTWLAHLDANQMSVRRGENEALGLYYTTLCSYLNAYPPTQSTLALNPSVNEYSQSAFAGCQVWPAPPLTARVTQLVPSEIPTLLLTGQFDSALPAYLSTSLRAALHHSYAYALPTGHTAIASQCGLSLTTAFLADPQTEPAASCVTDMGVDWVLPE